VHGRRQERGKKEAVQLGQKWLGGSAHAGLAALLFAAGAPPDSRVASPYSDFERFSADIRPALAHVGAPASAPLLSPPTLAAIGAAYRREWACRLLRTPRASDTVMPPPPPPPRD
jgi:hypothetical protein